MMWTISEGRFERESEELAAGGARHNSDSDNTTRPSPSRQGADDDDDGDDDDCAQAQRGHSIGGGARAAASQAHTRRTSDGAGASVAVSTTESATISSWEWVPETRDASGSLRLRPGFLRLQRQLVTAVRPVHATAVGVTYRDHDGHCREERGIRAAESGSVVVGGGGSVDDDIIGSNSGSSTATDDCVEAWVEHLHGQPTADDAELNMALSSTAGAARVAEFEYHVLYSQAYAVPVLYFSVTELDGTPVTGDDAVWECVLPCKPCLDSPLPLVVVVDLITDRLCHRRLYPRVLTCCDCEHVGW
jgi:hypothetical protein